MSENNYRVLVVFFFTTICYSSICEHGANVTWSSTGSWEWVRAGLSETLVREKGRNLVALATFLETRLSTIACVQDNSLSRVFLLIPTHFLLPFLLHLNGPLAIKQGVCPLHCRDLSNVGRSRVSSSFHGQTWLASCKAPFFLEHFLWNVVECSEGLAFLKPRKIKNDAERFAQISSDMSWRHDCAAKKHDETILVFARHFVKCIRPQ